jgi:PAS domain S-box-containing protein
MNKKETLLGQVADLSKRAEKSAGEKTDQTQGEEDTLRESHFLLEQRVAELTAQLQQEIATRKKSQAALRESEENFYSFFNIPINYGTGKEYSLEKILLVDDEQSVLDAFSRQLRKKYNMETAASGSEGLKKIADSGPFAVIIADMRMPVMDGITFLREVRQATPESVRMMLTGNPDQQTAIEAIKHGAIFRFLAKPCSPENLEEALDAGLAQYRLIAGEKELLKRIKLQASLIMSMLDSIPDIIFFKDINGVYLGCNPPFAEVVGKLRNEIIGRTDYDLFDKESADFFREDDRQLIELQKVRRNEEWITYPDGRKKLLDTLKTPYWGEDGSLIGILCISRDITDRKRAEEEKKILEAQNRQLQKSESLGRMAGSIAHHFNNKLGAVIGNLELALMELPKGANPQVRITAAMKASHQAAEISGMMLTYLGQSFEKRELLDLSDACVKSLPMLQAVMPLNVVLEKDLPAPGPVISTNTDYIKQVLTNLVTNAWEAIGKNSGTVSLRVKTVSPAQIPAENRHPIDWQAQDDAYACLEIADTGCGIEDEAIEKIFDPFFSTKFTGRGMGLAVVLGILKTHNGVLTVESTPKQGSTFRIFFPLSEETFLRSQKAGSSDDSSISEFPPVKSEGGGTVLVVEDDEMLRNMAATMITSLGFAVLEAIDGVEALEIFGKHESEIKFVLSDLTMPRMNGWETLASLRKLQPGIPVILASGYDKAHVMEGDHPELPQAFLAKPYNLKALRNAISQALSNKKK